MIEARVRVAAYIVQDHCRKEARQCEREMFTYILASYSTIIWHHLFIIYPYMVQCIALLHALEFEPRTILNHVIIAVIN